MTSRSRLPSQNERIAVALQELFTVLNNSNVDWSTLAETFRRRLASLRIRIYNDTAAAVDDRATHKCNAETAEKRALAEGVARLLPPNRVFVLLVAEAQDVHGGAVKFLVDRVTNMPFAGADQIMAGFLKSAVSGNA